MGYYGSPSPKWEKWLSWKRWWAIEAWEERDKSMSEFRSPAKIIELSGGIEERNGRSLGSIQGSSECIDVLKYRLRILTLMPVNSKVKTIAYASYNTS